MLRDCRDLETSAPSRAALAAHEAALTLMLSMRADPLAATEAVLAEHPDFALAHAFRANLMVGSSEAAAVAPVRDSVAAIAVNRQATGRERAHAAAAARWADGDMDGARDAYGAILQTWPRDLMALQVVHQLDFFTGNREGLRDRPALVLRHWSGADLPGEGFVHGMLAFGLEENADYARAEEAGRRAVEMECTDAWAIHAVTHVLEMQGRFDEGVRWLGTRTADWAPTGPNPSMLAYHNWWHLALYKLERNDTHAALELYDRAIRTPGTAIALELVDASAMLWRLMLRGVDVGGRWDEVADAWCLHPPGFYVFNDLHALMAFAASGRQDRMQATLAAIAAAALAGGTNGLMSAQVGLPLARGLAAFAAGAHAEAAQLLAPLPAVARRIGGSNAQRDLIDLTLLEAQLRAGDRRGAARRALDRLEAKPESPFARLLAGRAAAITQAA